MVTKDNKDDRKRAEKALEAAGFKVAKVMTENCVSCLKQMNSFFEHLSCLLVRVGDNQFFRAAVAT